MLGRIKKYDFDEQMGELQHKFRPGHSTDSSASEVVSHIAEFRDKKRVALCYSMDLTAFDLLRKEELAKIMVKKGISIGLTRLSSNTYEIIKDMFREACTQ